VITVDLIDKDYSYYFGGYIVIRDDPLTLREAVDDNEYVTVSYTVNVLT